MGLHDSVRLSRKQGTNRGVHGTRLCLCMAMPGCAVPGPFVVAQLGIRMVVGAE